MGRPKGKIIICSVEGCNNIGIRYYGGQKFCSKHITQLDRHGKIEDKRNILSKCCVCGKESRSRWKDGKEYCQKHYMQLYHHGHLLKNTIFEKNEWILHEEEGYAECITKDKNFNINGIVKFDIEDYQILKDKKIYLREGKYGKNPNKYAIINLGERKCFAHRYVLGFFKKEYNLYCAVDHINGDSLDNRKKNLRICSQKDNMKNIRKNNKIVGVNKYGDKWTSRIESNYHTYNIGKFSTLEEAVIERIKKEKELFGNYGPNKDLFYILEMDKPIEEIKDKLKELNIKYD